MYYSKTGLHLTEDFELCRLRAYQDQGGIWTIGYGHTLGVREGDVCTKTQATVWLLGDVQNAVRTVNHLVRVPLSQGEFDALVDLTFNIGGAAFEHSTLLKFLNAADYLRASGEFGKWCHVRGRICRDLVIRRHRETAQFKGHDLDLGNNHWLTWSYYEDQLLGGTIDHLKKDGSECGGTFWVVNSAISARPIWNWNGDLLRPTLTPSFNCHCGESHGFITDGAWTT